MSDARSTTERNIDTISAIERDALEKRSVWARVGDTIAVQAGRAWFIGLNLVSFTLWICFNLSTDPRRVPLDPFPFPLLNLVVSLEAIFLAMFILMSQNRSNLQAEHRNHLDLQINLLSEHENTKMLQMLTALCAHHGLVISGDLEVAELAKPTEPQEVLEQLKKNLP